MNTFKVEIDATGRVGCVQNASGNAAGRTFFHGGKMYTYCTASSPKEAIDIANARRIWWIATGMWGCIRQLGQFVDFPGTDAIL